MTFVIYLSSVILYHCWSDLASPPAGNAVLYKPSEHAPLSGAAIGRLLAQAGLPPGETCPQFCAAPGSADVRRRRRALRPTVGGCRRLYSRSGQGANWGFPRLPASPRVRRRATSSHRPTPSHYLLPTSAASPPPPCLGGVSLSLPQERVLHGLDADWPRDRACRRAVHAAQSRAWGEGTLLCSICRINLRYCSACVKNGGGGAGPLQPTQRRAAICVRRTRRMSAMTWRTSKPSPRPSLRVCLN